MYRYTTESEITGKYPVISDYPWHNAGAEYGANSKLLYIVA